MNSDQKVVTSLIFKMKMSLTAGSFAVGVSCVAHTIALVNWTVLSKVLLFLTFYYAIRVLVDVLIWTKYLKEESILNKLDAFLKIENRSFSQRIKGCETLLLRYQLFTAVLAAETFIRIARKLL